MGLWCNNIERSKCGKLRLEDKLPINDVCEKTTRILSTLKGFQLQNISKCYCRKIETSGEYFYKINICIKICETEISMEFIVPIQFSDEKNIAAGLENALHMYLKYEDTRHLQMRVKTILYELCHNLKKIYDL